MTSGKAFEACLSSVTVFEGIMHQHRFRLVVVSVCACIALYASRGANAQSPPNSSSPQMHKDAPFHTGGEYKSEVTAASKPQVTPVADHNAYPQVPLAKIEILPAAITISGSHYNQRLVVEGTYTDGHQEDLTAKATLGISNQRLRASSMILLSPKATAKGPLLRRCRVTASAFRLT